MTVSASALIHNVATIKRLAPEASIVAMLKTNAYGCGVERVAPELVGHVEALGVATLEEAAQLMRLGIRVPCVVFQGAYEPNDWLNIAQYRWEAVLHQARQLNWLLATPLPQPVKLWIKINTGMNRLGFMPAEMPAVLAALKGCPWVDPHWIFMTHFANADEPAHGLNMQQWQQFQTLFPQEALPHRSVANSAAILTGLGKGAGWVRPGLMLYGVSPFSAQTGGQLGLRPVMCFETSVMHCFTVAPGASVGYGSTWVAPRPTRVGVVAAGYGDGYPRCVAPQTPVVIQGQRVPIIGRISMETLTVDLTQFPSVQAGDAVALWGETLPIEEIAQAAGTIPYELMVKVRER